MIDHPGFCAKIVTAGTSPRGVVSVFIESNDPAALAARVLRYQREVQGHVCDRCGVRVVLHEHRISRSVRGS